MPTPPPAFDVTVSIATYDRLEGLERTIRSVVGQRNALGLTYEILVTDNHLSGNAEPLVARLAAESAVAIRYQREVTRNMSVLRNAGIAEVSFQVEPGNADAPNGPAVKDPAASPKN